MTDDVILNKVATIERCVQRAREEYEAEPETFATNFTRQDAAILNIQRACEAALDIGHYLIRRDKLGIPQGARDVFSLLERAQWIDSGMSESLKRMVGFRNIAVHDYRALQLPIVTTIIEKHLDDFLAFGRVMLKNAPSRD
ncbi:type VII toxin-antitoxin system HepT family RNase toxin [Saccharospirillum salsuginis]|uniref:Toxin-antitoxin antitoxin component n=1 Tax=Saccharospirillum salsuginis TaxID=418750 RepID=A0A918KEF6_9GAMM|nr:DUF86 domain-containing protein [Saccharospirillum salsuginis]GGX58356.1 hypothetical protein GCM10007392_27740 [Saccharospirillum salsuginis]